MPDPNCPNCKGLGGYPSCPVCHNITPKALATSTCSLEKLKADFDRAIAAMSDQEIIEAFREAGCEATIQRQENEES